TGESSERDVPVRTFGWSDMFLEPDDDPRADGGFDNNERAMLVGFLGDRRLTFEMKCAGLDAAGMARRSVEPSDLSLLGLLRHLTDVERYWFRHEMAGLDVPNHYGNRDFEEALPDPGLVAAAWETWREEVAFAEQFVESSPDLGVLGEKSGVPLREVLVHMIEEYARHNGHADLLRERIDGRVGQ
ncbi:MAG: hypothetical protein QOJ71_97, partial [Actinomycetota bacterium]|nr:hypothetical protein [Actinomycetota bacterium]